MEARAACFSRTTILVGSAIAARAEKRRHAGVMAVAVRSVIEEDERNFCKCATENICVNPKYAATQQLPALAEVPITLR